jgi:Base plate wedge protein 53
MTVYNKTSPYYNTPIANGVLGILTFVDIPSLPGDAQYTLTSRYLRRPDLLASDIYGDPQLWWVFAVRNKDVIKDSIYDFVPGQTIFIPTLTTIKKALGS